MMNRSKTVIIVLVGLLCLVSTALVLVHSSQNKKSLRLLSQTLQILSLNNKIDYLQSEIDRAASNRIQEFKTLALIPNFDIIALDSKSVMKVSDIPSGTFIFSFSNTHCSSCFEHELKIINEALEEDESLKIAIITNTDSNKKLKAMAQAYDIKATMYRTQNVSFEDFPSQPIYLFIKDKTVNYGFFANENYSQMTKEFFLLSKEMQP
jgi:hypothetical protein